MSILKKNIKNREKAAFELAVSYVLEQDISVLPGIETIDELNQLISKDELFVHTELVGGGPNKKVELLKHGKVISDNELEIDTDGEILLKY
jgi:hypothetical protein